MIKMLSPRSLHIPMPFRFKLNTFEPIEEVFIFLTAEVGQAQIDSLWAGCYLGAKVKGGGG